MAVKMPGVNEAPKKDCPECGRTMHYYQRGWCWDGSPSFHWKCWRCWRTIYDGERPWPLTLFERGLVVVYIERYGGLPAHTDPVPDDFCLQLRLFK